VGLSRVPVPTGIDTTLSPSKLAEGLEALLARIGEEISFNDAKGTAPYRLGMHDGLRFAEDAVADLLRRHGRAAETADRRIDA
jgi:hypothetical protein